MRSYTEDQLRALVDQGTRELQNASAQEALAWVDDTFGDQWAAASNMQDAVLINLAAQQHAGIDILFIDTGYHFPETLGMADAVEVTYDIHLVRVMAEQTVAEHEAKYGPNLCARDPSLQGQLRKVQPLARTLKNYSAWVTGIRRAESWTRAHAPMISFDDLFGLVKINPLVFWSDEQMDDYINQHHILTNPLLAEGYTSIGCAPCTSKPSPGQDKRSGRWAGTEKIECGLHPPTA